MIGPLLETKLHVPTTRRGLVARPELLDRLRAVPDATVTLVAAPAGFGKTTLLTEWTRTASEAVAWLSLDHRDNDPAVFWRYVIAALRTIDPDLAAGAVERLHAPSPDLTAVVVDLVNDLAPLPHAAVLVLDDYHVIESPEVQQGVALLVEHMPPHLHLVLTSRADPALPLARLRARGELLEIRVADLRFSTDEAASYLNDVMGLDLSAADVAALEERTEGWVAALQLAGLSLQGRSDASGFIAGFAGDDRYVVDYLVEEVLDRQPDTVRDFLLRTSMLGRLSAPLCDAVTGRDDGRAMLEALDRSNLFLIPLGAHRRWYRYHHLFAEVLRSRLLLEHPEQVAELNRRASSWHEEHGHRDEAVEHALDAGDIDRTADLIELALPALLQGRNEVTLNRWMRALPEAVFAVRPVLSMGSVGSLMLLGELDGVDGRLRQVERWLEERSRPGAPEPTGVVIVDDEQLRRLPGTVAFYRSGHALATGDLAATEAHARRALEVAADDDHFARGAAAALLGLASWHVGDLRTAERSYAEGMASPARAGHDADVVGGAVTRADLRIAQGCLDDAMRIYEEGLRRATEPAGTPLRGAADMHVGMSHVLIERNALEEAEEHLRRSRDLGAHTAMPQNGYRSALAMARLRLIEGDGPGALGFVAEAEREFFSDFSPVVRPMAAVRARVQLALGRLREAEEWVRAHGVSVDDDLSYLREFEHMTLARVLLARGTRDGGPEPVRDARGLLQRLLRAAEDGGRMGSAIELLVLTALAEQAHGDLRGAEAALRRAIDLAEPEGYVRVFADEGAPVVPLLRAVARQGAPRAYVASLLAATEPGTSVRAAPQGLIDPLSERELVVLRLLATDLSGPEIARELVVSLNTVRTHSKHIYTKLGVNSRRAAVRRADELHLLSRAR